MEKQMLYKKIKEVCDKQNLKKAVISESNSLTYDQLHKKSDSIAQLVLHILEEKFKTTDQEKIKFNSVCLYFSHDENIIISLLAILKANQVFVPLDPLSPIERNNYIINDTSSDIILTDSKNIENANDLVKLNIGTTLINIDDVDEALLVGVQTEGPAYIMYTSGSTGKPKGVIQNTQSLFYLLDEYKNTLSLNAQDKVCLTTPYTHTVSVIDIFSTLLAGGTICMYNLKIDFVLDKFLDWINESDISILHLVPTVFRHMLNNAPDSHSFSTVSMLILGGENVLDSDCDLFRKYFSEKCYMINLYGCSELIISNLKVIKHDSDIDKSIIPVGKTFKGVDMQIVDDENEIVDVLQDGNIMLASNYLTSGYCNLPGITSDSFFTIPNISSSPIFKNGDIGRLNLDGDFEYLGRNDNQIKINGNRVELEEIEVVLNKIEGIEQVVVTATYSEQHNSNIIVAYYISSDESIDEEMLSFRLSALLPIYMIPAAFIRLMVFPYTESGKIDRKSLPDPLDFLRDEFVEPTTEMEKEIAACWKTIFNIEKIGIYDNFFKLGGNSLLASSLSNLLTKEFDVQVSVLDVFEYPTISKLTELLNRANENMSTIEDIINELEELD